MTPYMSAICTVQWKPGFIREEKLLSEVSDAIKCEHFPTQVSFNDELQSGRDLDEVDDLSRPVRWMDYLGKGEVLTNTDLWTIFERNRPFVYIEKVLNLWVQLMKNEGKNKCCL